jgi:alkaline phosphatase
MKKYYSLLVVLIMALGVSGQETTNKKTEVKNVILLIGDGMGISQIYAGYTANRGYLNIFKSSNIGLSITYSADNFVTDSGAGGTAISSGKKTNNNSVGVDSKGMALKTILEIAEENGMSTGMVVTSSITHATPASFIAHQESREENFDIAHDFITSGIDIFIGGGKDYFEDPKKNINISDSLRRKGYDIVYRLDDIRTDANINTGCLMASNELPSLLKGRGDYLVKAVDIALDRLSKNDNGFFIMVEGSQIDWGGHYNNLQMVISELNDFDDAVGTAFKFADTHPGTIVIITADHETGGLNIVDGNISTGEVNGRFSTRFHSAVMVPVFAYGQGAEIFNGVYQNTEIYSKMMQLLGLK